ncbi:hypothetical protein [Ralstonia phage RP13]|nr:hypothetical protein [Ralstonia phage RP13]
MNFLDKIEAKMNKSFDPRPVVKSERIKLDVAPYYKFQFTPEVMYRGVNYVCGEPQEDHAEAMKIAEIKVDEICLALDKAGKEVVKNLSVAKP